MHVLCVAEKPSISKSISQILSGGQFTTHATRSQYIKNYEFAYPQTNSFFVVTCVTGHLTTSDFTERHRKWNSCDAFELFDAPIETKVDLDKKAIEENLLTQARRADMLMVWTDCDREGEHIGVEIMRVCKRAKRNIAVKRARFSAIIAQQIHRAAQHPVDIDQAQADAVEARITLDLKVGAAFTRMQTLILQNRFAQIADNKSVVSYGPCQFPALGFVVQKWKLAKSFVPEPFWYIYLSLIRPEGGSETSFTWQRGHLFDEEIAISIYDFVISNPLAHVMKVTKKGTKKWKPLPLTTVELQKAGSRLLRLAPKKILDIAEKLYQHGFLSYPRTETDQFDTEFDYQSLIQKQTVDPVWGEFATSLTQGGFSVPRRGKNNDKAHPPIHPTAHAGNIAGDEKRVYEFITRRFLACCSKDAEGWQTTVAIECGGEHFSASGLRVLERNYLLVYPYDIWSDHELPDFEEGEEFQPSVCELREGRTSKPSFLTEADLVGLMDKNGIGTDATIAQHIQTIIDRDYVIEKMEGSIKYLIPSKLGIGLIEGYNKIALNKSLSKPQLRRETERSMVQVCEGRKTKEEVLEEAIAQYKAMFMIAKREFGKVVSSVQRYLENNGENPGDEGGGENDQYGDEGGAGGGPGRASGRGSGRGRGRGRGGQSSTRGRSRPRRDTSDNTAASPPSDSDNDFVRPPATRNHTRQGTSSFSHQTKVSTSIDQAPDERATRPTSNDHRVLQCDCGVPAIQRAHTSESVSKGKKYWTCGNDDTCAFYQRDTVGGDENPLIPVKRPPPLHQDVTATEKRICKCNLSARRLTVNADKPNKGRIFWRCPNSQKDNDCGFFEWDDAAENGPTTHSRPATDECFRCNRPGHWAPNCPNDGINKRQRSFGSSSFDAGSSSITCFKCQQTGHFSNACPNGDMRRSGSRGGGSNDSTCYKCGKPGHWSSSCPDEGASNSVSGSRGARSLSKRGRGSGSTRAKRGRGITKKSAFGAPD